MSNYLGWIAPVGSISLDDLINDMGEDSRRGAITTFTGIVRENSDVTDKKVVSIEVETWEEEGTGSMDTIAKEIGDKHDLLGFRIIHLEGKIMLGMPIVYIVISSEHRKEAFSALEESINAYKQKSPVWKKEIYIDGTGSWITTAKNIDIID